MQCARILNELDEIFTRVHTACPTSCAETSVTQFPVARRGTGRIAIRRIVCAKTARDEYISGLDGSIRTLRENTLLTSARCPGFASLFWMLTWANVPLRCAVPGGTRILLTCVASIPPAAAMLGCFCSVPLPTPLRANPARNGDPAARDSVAVSRAFRRVPLVSEPHEPSSQVRFRAARAGRGAKALPRRRIRQTKTRWQGRYYDFNVCTPAKRVDKLRYMHRNPVRRGLVEAPEL